LRYIRLPDFLSLKLAAREAASLFFADPEKGMPTLKLGHSAMLGVLVISEV
jgi:hypothetical protein